MEEELAFGERLRSALKGAGLRRMSPTWLATQFNLHYAGKPVTPQAVRKWLASQSIPSQEKIIALSRWLGVSSEWLRFGARQNAHDATKISDDEALCADLMRLALPHRRIVRQMVNALLELEHNARSPGR